MLQPLLELASLFLKSGIYGYSKLNFSDFFSFSIYTFMNLYVTLGLLLLVCHLCPLSADYVLFSLDHTLLRRGVTPSPPSAGCRAITALQLGH